MAHKLLLPRAFWSDHYNRCADQDGEREILRDGPKVLVALDDEALANLKNDAEYYTHPHGPESSLGMRSRATLDAIGRQLPNWRSPWDSLR